MDVDSKTLMPLVCLDMTHPHNTEYPFAGIVPDRGYVVMGQVAKMEAEGRKSKLRGIAHYILFDIREGKMLRGMFHADRFRYVRDDDPFA